MALTGSEAAIYEAMAFTVNALAASLALPVSEPNVEFAPPRAGNVLTGRALPYLAVTYMPNGADLDGLAFDSDVTHIGLLQVSVFWPSGQGMVKPMQVAARLVSAFKPGTWIERNGISVHVERQPTVAPALQDSDLVQIPVTVRWRACAPVTA